ncbi:sialin-like [Onthophagus taurus]|uniref:sialin-like n=1 Tax=Onthophagus taurus TaxID=166361 RepID=UPI0039BDE92C
MDTEQKKGFFGLIQCRYIVACLGSIGMAIAYGLKVNLSVAIVTMVNHTALELSNSQVQSDRPPIQHSMCLFNDSNHNSIIEDGPFKWSNTLQGTILSSYFWGYLISLIPGGRIAELFSAKWVMFFAIAINTICTLLTPITAKIHYSILIMMRVGQGIGGGVTFPAMHVLLARWSLPNERSVMSSVVYAGTSLGTVLSTLSAGIIADYINWEAVFYIMGGLNVIWLVLWVFFVFDDADSSPIISENEKKLINSLLKGNYSSAKKSFPLKQVLTSMPFWAILIAHTCSNWGWYMILIELPLYMKSILQLNVSESSKFISLGFFLMWVFSILLSRSLDYFRGKKIITTTFARKISTLIASVIPLGCFLGLSYIGCSRGGAIALTILAIVAIAGMFCGFLSNHIDIAPNYAGTLVAFTNTIATIPGIVVPMFVGGLIENDPGIYSWRIIFFTTIILYIIEIFFYVIFASGEEQDWNKNNNDNVEAQPLKNPQSPDGSKQDYKATLN